MSAETAKTYEQLEQEYDAAYQQWANTNKRGTPKHEQVAAAKKLGKAREAMRAARENGALSDES